MDRQEELELLCSRFLDGELSPAERARLDRALAEDPALRRLLSALQRVDESVRLSASAPVLPVDFTERVMAGLDYAADDPTNDPADHAGGKVVELRPFGWRNLWAAAAAVVLVAGLALAAAFVPDAARAPVDVVADKTGDAQGTVGPAAPRLVRPSAELVAVSSGQVQILDGDGQVRADKRIQGRVALPATVAAPADSHAVLRVGQGTVVLPPGGRARLSEVDADGVPDVEPLDGDLYLESGSRPLRTRVADVAVRVQDGGVTLRREGSVYVAQPSHGAATVGKVRVGWRQCARIAGSEVQLADCRDTGLESWAIDGRVDAIKLELRNALGERYEQITERQWQQWEALLRGVMSRPAERAANAYGLRFLLKHGLLDEATQQERDALERIAAIMAEGTTEADIPPQVQQFFQAMEEELTRNPELLREYARGMRSAMERAAERHK